MACVDGHKHKWMPRGYGGTKKSPLIKKECYWCGETKTIKAKGE